MGRGKTGVPRVAVLWRRTVEAIKAYQAEARHESSYLFVGRTGQPYDGNHVGRNFRRIRSEAGVPDDVEFAHIRDGAYSAAFNADGVEEKHAKVLAGHRSGMSDAYVKRNPPLRGRCRVRLLSGNSLANGTILRNRRAFRSTRPSGRSGHRQYPGQQVSFLQHLSVPDRNRRNENE